MHFQDKSGKGLSRYSIVDQWAEKVKSVSALDYNESEMKGRGFLRYDRVKFHLSALLVQIEITKMGIVANTLGTRLCGLRKELGDIVEKESGKIKVIAYVIETSNNLAVYKNTVEIGEIPADSTAEIEIPVVLSNNSYKVDILIFENEKLVLKGKLTISAYPVYLWDEITHGVKQVWHLENTVYDFEQIH